MVVLIVPFHLAVQMEYINRGLDPVRFQMAMHAELFRDRLVAGVRRWMGHPASSHNDIMKKSMVSANVVARVQPYGKAETLVQSTGALATQLLHPKVSQEELMEYHRLVLELFVFII